MIWTLRVSFLLFLAWLIFLASPFVALYDLAKAVETRDMPRIEARVNFRALRVSIARQILGDYLKTSDGQESLGPLDTNVAANAGAQALNPYIEKIVNPKALADLLAKGGLSEAGGRAASNDPLAIRDAGFDLETLRKAWLLFIDSESQGFRIVTIPLPPEEARDDQFRLTWRLSGITWRLTGIDLPRGLREDLIRRMPPEARRPAG